MKKLKVDIDDIASAMEMSFIIEIAYQYLDTDTGDIILIRDSIMRQVEEEEDIELISANADWMLKEADKARLILEDKRDRYVEIPHIASHESYDIMMDFVMGIKNNKIRQLLLRAINGRKPFRRFKECIAQWPDILDSWYSYKDKRIKEMVIDWLASIDIEPE